MLDKLRQRSGEESGFTLVELLVVMLILGILAAIAIPSFFNQRDKANDAEAKANVRTAATAAETLATDNDGSYATVSAATLEGVEPSLGNANITAASGTATTYTIEVTADTTGREFRIVRAADGTVTYPCDPVGGGCPAGGWG